MKKPSSQDNLSLHAFYVVNKHIPPGDYRFMYPDFSACCSATYALPVDHERADSRPLVDIGVGEGFKPQDIVHYFRLLIYLIRNRSRFDFVHYYSTMLILVGPWLTLLAGLPSVITVTGFGRVFSSDSFKYRLLKPLYKLLFGLAIRLSQGILFQNHADLATVVKWFPQHEKKIFYIGSAVEVPVCEEKDFTVSPLRVLLVARLHPGKGRDDFLDVAGRMHSNSFEFVLVGPTSLGFDALARRVQCAANRGVVRYTGQLDADATQQQFAAAHIFFFPSSYGEGLARVMLEAGFARLCPIAYDIPSNRDLITTDRGFLLPVGDTEKVVQTIRHMKQEYTRLEQVACNYQSFVVESYNMTTFARRQDTILERLFSDGSHYR
jgi:glycosyltransferase involved in cell wall biosynthesis